MKLYNTLSRQKETLSSASVKKTIRLYTCGPTVYDYTHIGHGRKYVMDDVLKRSLTFLGYDVKHVMNITDVGHLSGDDDTGEDKLEKGSKKSGKSVWDVVKFYTDFFYSSMNALNTIPADVVWKATDHISEMVEMVSQLEKKGHTYETDEAVYFDISTFPSYGNLSKQKLDEKQQAVREEVHVDPQKKHPADFSLWFKCVGRFKDHIMRWESPWGTGFPGWHIECSAISLYAFKQEKYQRKDFFSNDLDEQSSEKKNHQVGIYSKAFPIIDIHTGGIDHIPVHHENEIAQSESFTGHQFVKIWMHYEFLNVEGEKMSKSKENFYTLDDIIKHGIDPVALRYLFLQTHYRKPMNFTWESAQSAHEVLKDLRKKIHAMNRDHSENLPNVSQFSEVQEFKNALSDDLNFPKALAVLWNVVKPQERSDLEKSALIEMFDKVLGLNLFCFDTEVIPQNVLDLADKRQKARDENDFEASDSLREQIHKMGYEVEDTNNGPVVKKK